MIKSGIDYFPLDVTLDAKFELIEAEFGLTGFGVVVHLLQEMRVTAYRICSRLARHPGEMQFAITIDFHLLCFCQIFKVG